MNPSTKRGIIGIAISLALGTLIALAGNAGSVEAWGMGLFGLCVLLAFAIQIAVFIPSFIAQTEHYFDLTGSITYLSVIALALALSPTLDLSSIIIAVLNLLRVSFIIFSQVQLFLMISLISSQLLISEPMRQT